MGRPTKNTVDYFPFYVSEGRTSRYIDNAYGNDGFSLWVRILRELGKTENHYIRLDDEKILLDLVSICKVTEKKWWKIVKDLSRFGVFHRELLKDHNVLFCPEFCENLLPLYKSRGRVVITINDIYLIITGKNSSLFKKNAVVSTINPYSIVEYSIVKKKLNKEILKRIGPTQYKLITENEFEWPESEELFEIIIFWLEYKKQRGQHYKAKIGITTILNRFKKHNDTALIISEVQRAVSNNAQGIYINAKKKTKTNYKSFKNEDYDKEETW